MRDDWTSVAFATYREDYYMELSSHVWRLNKGYPYNATLGGGLHRYMMAKWYGEDVLREFTQRGYVVDHMNNDHMDCRICNLEFLLSNRNVAKGQYLDAESKKMRHRLAICIYKDFGTGYYQIAIGCNDNICYDDTKGKKHFINTIHLLYDCEYSLVILDAECILTHYEETGILETKNLHWCDIRIVEAPEIVLTEDEKNQTLVQRDGKTYMVIGNGKVYIHAVHQIEDWRPPKDCK